MSVELEPSELGFRRPFDHEVTETLKITNPHNAPVAFKVKTTAPKQYCVRPNSGMIEPNASVDVQVLLQAMKEEPPLDAKCKDKFLVQSVLVTAEQDPNVATLWQTVEKTKKSSIQERKIKVNFLPASGATTNGVVAAEERHGSHPSPTPQFGSPAQTTSDHREPATPASSVKPAATHTPETTSNTSTTAAITKAIPTSGDELKQQLAAAQEQIAKLTSQLADPQVRQRKMQEAQEKLQTVVHQTQDQGVPLQIVAGLCLLSFLIAYIFF